MSSKTSLTTAMPATKVFTLAPASRLTTTMAARVSPPSMRLSLASSVFFLVIVHLRAGPMEPRTVPALATTPPSPTLVLSLPPPLPPPPRLSPRLRLLLPICLTSTFPRPRSRRRPLPRLYSRPFPRSALRSLSRHQSPRPPPCSKPLSRM
ncbi:hypothetical protein BN1708_015762 [Verticillium longisporum]|uniref:Uncharacterized protein n=1 Tax=Verticillium longisporum TaxID=100787 RepID=A0A0G4M797_VERLO|nr:hypothetical protein BN1708_015762 [Verticillium longisporum]